MDNEAESGPCLKPSEGGGPSLEQDSIGFHVFFLLLQSQWQASEIELDVWSYRARNEKPLNDATCKSVVKGMRQIRL